MRRMPRARLPRSAEGWLRAGAVAAILLACALAFTIRAAATPAQTAQRLIGQPAPPLALPAEQGGHPLPGMQSLQARRGHAVLVVYFFTLCPHCLSAIATAQAATSGDSVRVPLDVLYIDSPAEHPDIPAAYLARVGVDAPVLLDAGGHAAARYGVRYFPTYVLVDARGTVRGVWVGETSAVALRLGIAALAP